jgi:DNA polymerase
VARTREPPDLTAVPFLPEKRSLRALQEAARGCRGCPLWERATQTVFGEGRTSARLLLVGEQPGDQEDLAGRPFVGPAGRVLDRALEAAGIERATAYVTNAVKHFKWRPAGKRRIHEKPRTREILACEPWLEAEIEALRPDAIVALGATAAQALFGKDVRVTRDRGRPLPTPRARFATVTVHPSSILRAASDEERHRAMDAFVADLQVVATHLRRPPAV